MTQYQIHIFGVSQRHRHGNSAFGTARSVSRSEIAEDLEVESGLTANGVGSQLETALEPFDENPAIHISEVIEE